MMPGCEGFLVIGEQVNHATAVLVGQDTCPQCLDQAESIASALGTTVVPMHQTIHTCAKKKKVP